MNNYINDLKNIINNFYCITETDDPELKKIIMILFYQLMTDENFIKELNKED